MAGSFCLPSNPLFLTWALEMGSVLTRKLPEQELLPRVYLILALEWPVVGRKEVRTLCLSLSPGLKLSQAPQSLAAC